MAKEFMVKVSFFPAAVCPTLDLHSTDVGVDVVIVIVAVPGVMLTATDAATAAAATATTVVDRA